MIEEKYLKHLGFTDFIHLDKSKRDSKRRLFMTKSVGKENLIMILVMEDIWKIDYLSYSGDQIFFKKFSTSPPILEELIRRVFQDEDMNYNH